MLQLYAILRYFAPLYFPFCLYIHPATPPRKDFVQLRSAPENEKCDRRKLKWF